MKKIIMVVDDDLGSRHTLKCRIEDYLKSYNDEVEVVEAEDGLAAWRLLIYDKIKPDMIFTDFEMPRMNGIQLIDKIDAELKLATKIVVCSGLYSIMGEVEKRGRYFLKKPFRKNDLYEIIKKVMNIS